MQIIVKSRKAIEGFRSVVPYLHIEYYSTITKPASLLDDPNRVAHVRLKVDDIERDVKGLILFNEKHARQIVEALRDNIDRIELIVCQCNAGISRSAGTAAALDRYLNQKDDISGNSKYFPNIHILTTLYRQLEKEKIYGDNKSRFHEKR